MGAKPLPCLNLLHFCNTKTPFSSPAPWINITEWVSSCNQVGTSQDRPNPHESAIPDGIPHCDGFRTTTPGLDHQPMPDPHSNVSDPMSPEKKQYPGWEVPQRLLAWYWECIGMKVAFELSRCHILGGLQSSCA
jgi:hypothetical protein